MNMHKQIFHLAFAALLLLSLTSCRMADLSQQSDLAPAASEEKARELLDLAVEAQGFSALEAQPLYQYTATDHWPGFMGNMTKLWPQQETRFEFKYHFNTFDGHLTFLDGAKEGEIVGLQTWHYYEQPTGDAQAQKTKPGNKEDKFIFGLSAFQYFNELAYRLKKANVVRYYGKQEVRGVMYDLVFASWWSEEPNDEHDQYVLYLNPTTHLVDYTTYTLRNNNNPITRKFYGSIAFTDYTDVGGFKAAKKHTVYLNDDGLTTEDREDYFHRITVETFDLGGFEEAELYPLPGIAKQIDTK